MPLSPDDSTIDRAAIANKLLSENLFPSEDDSDTDSDEEDSDGEQKDPLASRVWRMYTKAKDNLPNGARMENLTWRMMAMTLKSRASATERSTAEKQQNQKQQRRQQQQQQSSSSSSSIPVKYETEPMAIDDDVQEQPVTTRSGMTIDQQRNASSSPPMADDTTTLLSSSAPPFMMDFLRENVDLPPEQRNVMVSGSTRASSTSSSEEWLRYTVGRARPNPEDARKQD